MIYFLLSYFIFISRNLMNMALAFASFVIILGLELIASNHTLIGLVLIGVYVGAIIILIVFLIMNIDLSADQMNMPSLGFSTALLIVGLCLYKVDYISFSSWNYSSEFNLYNGISTILFSETPIILYVLVNLLLLTLITCNTVLRRL